MNRRGTNEHTSSKNSSLFFLFETATYFSKLLERMDFLALSSAVVMALQIPIAVLCSGGVSSLYALAAASAAANSSLCSQHALKAIVHNIEKPDKENKGLKPNLVEERDEDVNDKRIPRLDLGLSIHTGDIVFLRDQRLELLQFQSPKGTDSVQFGGKAGFHVVILCRPTVKGVRI